MAAWQWSPSSVRAFLPQMHDMHASPPGFFPESAHQDRTLEVAWFGFAFYAKLAKRYSIGTASNFP
jgi:hypothetical protein